MSRSLLKSFLAIDHRQPAQVLSIEPKQIEGIEAGLTATMHQFVERECPCRSRQTMRINDTGILPG